MTSTAETAFLEFRRTGDARALTVAFEATAPELLRVAAFLLPRDEAEDAVHDTYVVAMTRRDGWDQQRPLLPWLLGVLANEARGRRRRRRLQQRASPAVVPAAMPDPVTAAQVAEFDEGFARAMRELPAADADLLRLHLCDELSCREIGERLQRPAGTVRTQVSRAMSELRRRLPVAIGVAVAMPGVDAVALARLRERVLARAQAPDVADAWVTARASNWVGIAAVCAVLIGIVAAIVHSGVFGPAELQPGPLVASSPPSPTSPPPSTGPGADTRAPELRDPPVVPPPAVAPPWVLRGRVRDEQGNGIAGAEVRLRHGEFEPRIHRTLAGADGSYTLDLAFWRDRPALDRRAGFFVKVHARGCNTYPYFGEFPQAARRDAPLELAADFELSPYPTVSGRVVDSHGRPVAALVMASDPANDSHSHGMDHAEADGTFLVVAAGVETGKVELSFYHPAGAPVRRTVEVVEGQDTPVGTIELGPGHPVTGRVELADGSPLAGCEVSLRTEGVRSAFRDFTTGDDGTFTYVRAQANAWSAQLMSVSTEPGGTWGRKFEFPATMTAARLTIDAALLELHWLDPDGERLLPVHAVADVFVAGRAEPYATQNGKLGWLLVPGGSEVAVRANLAGGLAVAERITAPAGGRKIAELRFRQLPMAAFTVQAGWDDGRPVDPFDCEVDGVDADNRFAAEATGSSPGTTRWLAPVGNVKVRVRGYPSQYDGGFVEVPAVVPADGSGSVKVVIPRRGRVAITLRDTAAADRIDDGLAGAVTVGGTALEHFVHIDGEDEVSASEPSLGRRMETLELLPPGEHEVVVRIDGWLPAKATVKVEVDRVADVVVWLQRR